MSSDVLKNKNIKYDDSQRRYLSGLETAFDNFMQKGHAMEFSVNILSSIEEISPNMVQQCFNVLSEKHQLLRSTIQVDENDDYYFKEVDVSKMKKGIVINDKDKEESKRLEVQKEILTNLPDQYEWMDFAFDDITEINQWHTYIQTELDKKFLHGNIMWRIRWLSVSPESDIYKYVMIVFVHHSILDGRGLFDLIAQQFLQLLNSLLENEDVNIKKIPVKLPNSLEQIFHNLNDKMSTIKGNWFLQKISDFMLWRLENRSGDDKTKTKPFLHTIEEPNYDCDYRFNTFIIDEKTSSNIMLFCKKTNVTVNTLLLVLISSCLKETQKKFTQMTTPITEFLYAIDLRKFNKMLCEKPIPCGTYAMPAKVTITPVEFMNFDEIRTQCRTLSSLLRKQNKPPSCSLARTKLTILSRDKYTRSKMVSNHRNVVQENMAMFSNIGNCDRVVSDVKCSKVKLEDHYFSLSVSRAFHITAATLNGKMQFCVTCNPTWVQQDFLNGFEECFITICSSFNE